MGLEVRIWNMTGTKSCQVAYPPQQDQRIYEGTLEQPKMVYYAEEDQIHNNGTRPVELRQPTNRVFDIRERFVSQNDVRGENGDDFLAHDFGVQLRQRSEMVLPSIEREIRDEHSDQTSLHGKTRQVNPFGSYPHLHRGMQPLPAPSIINLDDYEELPSSKRRRIDEKQPVSSHGQSRTILVPIEQLDDRRPRYEPPHEAVYRGGREDFVSDKRIVPLPPKGERARSPISHEELQLISPRKQIMRQPDQVADRVDWYPPSRDHYQIPLSRPENVEDLQFPSRTDFAPREYLNDSPSFLQSSQFASRRLESSDSGFPSRHDVGAIANSDRAYADPDGMRSRLQPLGLAERSMPSRFSDMSIDYTQREDDRRSDRVTYLPVTAMADLHRHPRPPRGALT